MEAEPCLEHVRLSGGYGAVHDVGLARAGWYQGSMVRSVSSGGSYLMVVDT
jgi:hypothetical protein